MLSFNPGEDLTEAAMAERRGEKVPGLTEFPGLLRVNSFILRKNKSKKKINKRKSKLFY